MSVRHIPLLLVLLVLPWVGAGAASFDCSKASTRIETLICADTTLSELDGLLAPVYRQALAIADDASFLKQSQRDWLKHRNTCADAACVTAAYRERIGELEDANGQSLHAAVIAGEYERNDSNYSAEVEPASITIKALPDGRVSITGEALWIGNAETGHVNIGTLEGKFEVRAGTIAYRDGEDEWSCVLTLRFTRDALYVREDHATCGGMNVRFGGHYSRN